MTTSLFFSTPLVSQKPNHHSCNKHSIRTHLRAWFYPVFSVNVYYYSGDIKYIAYNNTSSCLLLWEWTYGRLFHDKFTSWHNAQMPKHVQPWLPLTDGKHLGLLLCLLWNVSHSKVFGTLKENSVMYSGLIEWFWQCVTLPPQWTSLFRKKTILLPDMCFVVLFFNKTV